MSRYYTAGVGSILLPDAQLTRIEKLAREMKDNAWTLKSSAATDAGALLARADKTAGGVKRAILLSTIVTAVSTFAIAKTALDARRGR